MSINFTLNSSTVVYTLTYIVYTANMASVTSTGMIQSVHCSIRSFISCCPTPWFYPTLLIVHTPLHVTASLNDNSSCYGDRWDGSNKMWEVISIGGSVFSTFDMFVWMKVFVHVHVWSVKPFKWHSTLPVKRSLLHDWMLPMLSRLHSIFKLIP